MEAYALKFPFPQKVVNMTSAGQISRILLSKLLFCKIMLILKLQELENIEAITINIFTKVK